MDAPLAIGQWIVGGGAVFHLRTADRLMDKGIGGVCFSQPDNKMINNHQVKSRSKPSVNKPLSNSFDRAGKVVSSKPTHGGRGTSIIVNKLYADLPVRKQLYSDAKKKKQGLKELQHLMSCIGLARPEVRLNLKHDKEQLFSKSNCKETLEAVGQVFGVGALLRKVLRAEERDGEDGFDLRLFMTPLGSSQSSSSRKIEVKTYVSINGRSVILKEIEKRVKHFYSDCGADYAFKTAFCVLDLKMPAGKLDVNLSPNKWDVLVENSEALLSKVDGMLEKFRKTFEDQFAAATAATTAATTAAPSTASSATSVAQDTAGPIDAIDRSASFLNASLANVSLLNASAADVSIEGVYFDRVLNTGSDGTSRAKAPDVQTTVDRDRSEKATTRNSENDCLQANLEKLNSHDNGDLEWSKGNLLKDRNNEQVNPVLLAAPQKSALLGFENASPVKRTHDSTSLSASLTPVSKPQMKPQRLLPSQLAPPAQHPRPLPPQQQTLFESFSPRQHKNSQERIGFGAFERKKRGLIIKKNPCVSFARVSELVAEAWEELEEEEKMNFEAEELLQPRFYPKKHEAGAGTLKSGMGGVKRPNLALSEKMKSADKSKRSNESSFSDRKNRKRSPDRVGDRVDLNDFQPKKRRVSKGPTQRVVEVDYRFHDKVQKKRKSVKNSDKQDDLLVVGRIQYEKMYGWIVCEKNGDTRLALHGLNCHRLLETNLFQQLVRNFTIPSRELPHPEPLSEGLLNSEINSSGDEDSVVRVRDVLSRIAREHMGRDGRVDEVVLRHPFLVKNGFTVRVTEGEKLPAFSSAFSSAPFAASSSSSSSSSSFRAEFLSSSSLVSEVDFVHILQAISQSNNSSLADSRSPNVIDFLKKESERMARNAPLMTSRSEVMEALRELRGWTEGECLHGKSLFHKLKDVS